MSTLSHNGTLNVGPFTAILIPKEKLVKVRSYANVWNSVDMLFNDNSGITGYHTQRQHWASKELHYKMYGQTERTVFYGRASQHRDLTIV